MKRLIYVLVSILIILGLSGMMLPELSPSTHASAAPEVRGEVRTVLAEDFTGTWCGFCPYAAGGLKKLQDEVGIDNFVVLAFHYNDNMATTKTEARGSTYSVTGYPTVWIDGTIEERGASSVQSAYERYKADYNTRRAKQSPIKIESGGTISGSTASVEVEMTKSDTLPSNLYIRYVLYEDGVPDGGDTYNHVVRDIVEESIAAADFPLSKQKSFTISSGWNSANLGAAIWVQVGSNGEVLQSKFEDFNGPLNQPPVVSNPSKLEHIIKEDVSDSSLDLRTIFSDPESDPLTFTSDATETNNVQVTIATNGIVTLLSDENWNGNEEITFFATDSSYHTPVGHKINVIVQPVNDAPVASEDDIDILMTEDSENSDLNLNDVFSDVDGDPLTYSVSGDDNLGIKISLDGTVFIDSTGEFHGQEILTFTATDPSGGTGTKDVRVTVRSQNDQPEILSPLVDFSINEDEEDTSIDLSQVFEDPDGDPLYFTYEKNKNIGVTIDGKGKVTITPRKDWNGEETITFKATDRLSPNVKEDVTISVLPINDAPVPTLIESIYLTEDTKEIFNFEATDIEGDSITYETNIRQVITGLEVGKNYIFDDKIGEVTITATNEMVGSYTIKLTVKDDGSPPAESEPMEFELVIENTNDAPIDVTIKQPLPGAVYEKGEDIVFIGSADDPDKYIPDSTETLIYRWESDLVVGFIGTGEQLTKQLEPGEHRITLKVYDSGNAVSSSSITITVEGEGGTDTTSDPTKKGETQDKKSSPFEDNLWIILVIIAVVVAIVLLLSFMMMRKKKPELTPEEEQLQAYYNQLQETGMMDQMGGSPMYGYGYQQAYGTYPQQQMYPQQQVAPVTVAQQPVQPVQPAAAVAPVSAPLAAPKPAVAQLPPAPVEQRKPKKDLSTLPKTKPVTQPVPEDKVVQAQQPKDWNWDF